jgi:hypothetical protein
MAVPGCRTVTIHAQFLCARRDRRLPPTVIRSHDLQTFASVPSQGTADSSTSDVNVVQHILLRWSMFLRPEFYVLPRYVHTSYLYSMTNFTFAFEE